MTVSGAGQWIRNPNAGSGGDGCLLSARFLEDPATSGHAEQEILNAGAITMRWSASVRDELGMGSDWGHSPQSGTFLFPTSGWYLIVCYIQAEPQSCGDFISGNISVVLEPTFADPADTWWEQVSNPITSPGTKCSISALHRIDLDAYPGAGFWVDIHSWNVLNDGFVTRATISITRLCSDMTSEDLGN